jgi:subtilisin family serine protease
LLTGQVLEAASPKGMLLLKTAATTTPALEAENLARLRADDAIALANPVYVDPTSGLILIPTEEILVALRDGVDPRDYFGALWPTVKPLPGARGQYVLSLAGCTAERMLSEVAARHADDRVAWAEPNFICQLKRQSIPDDPLYPSQWYLHNSGQGTGKAGADINAPEAWSLGAEGEGVVIAIVDDGVELDHPDLMANIFHNVNDPIDGLDNDGNGYIDDAGGWNFVAGSNNPNPSDPLDAHGTAVAGLAAGVGGNAEGISGVAPRAKILPVKVLTGEGWPSTGDLASALRYCAGLTSPNPWRGADVINISLLLPPSTALDSALTDASVLGRGGLGCPVFTSTGNLASGYVYYELVDFLPGDYDFEWVYGKDEDVSDGDDTCWIADILFPDGTFETFDSPTLPSGWDPSPFGEVPWRIVDEPARAFGTSRFQARAGVIGHEGTTTIRSRRVTVTTGGAVSFYYWNSSEEGYDGLDFWVYDYVLGDYVGPFINTSGVPPIESGVAYPASHPDTIAVGSSSDFDYRSDYSQYGGQLDFLAPSDGGRQSVATCDLTGLAGNNGGNYTPYFGGTSAVAPIAAGVGAMLLSVNPNLPGNALRTWMRRTADPIGSVPYTNGFNAYYGFGRLNAAQAVQAVLGPILVPLAIEDGTFDFRLTRLPPAGTVVVERASRLGDWSPIRTNVVTGADLELSDAVPGGPATWFYRARLE